MRFLTKNVLFVMALAYLCAAPSAVLAQRGGKAGRSTGFVPSDEVLALHPEIWDYQYDAKQLRSIYADDLTTMAIGMYNLTGKEASRIGSLIQKMSSERSKGSTNVDSLIDRRARHFDTLVTTAEQTGMDLNDLILKDKTFAKYRAVIDDSKGEGGIDFTRVQEMVEQSMDRDAVSQAHETWRDNLEKLGPKVALQSVALEVAAAGGIDDEKFLHSISRERLGKPLGVKMDAVGKPDPNQKPIERMKEEKARAMRPAKPVDRKTAHGKTAASPSKAKAVKEKTQTKRATRQTKRPPAAQRKSPKAKRSTQDTSIPSAPPLSQWEQYVRDFIEEHKLSESQTHSALGILNEQESRARAVMARQENQRKRAAEIQDRRQQATQLAELDKPIDRLFSNLKTRLDQLLTTQQRAEARKNATSSRKTKRKSKGK